MCTLPCITDEQCNNRHSYKNFSLNFCLTYTKQFQRIYVLFTYTHSSMLISPLPSLSGNLIHDLLYVCLRVNIVEHLKDFCFFIRHYNFIV